MPLPRLSDLTAATQANERVLDAIRFLKCASVAPSEFADVFVANFPRAVSVPLARDFVRTKAASPSAVTTVPTYAGNLLPPAFVDPLTTALQRATILSRINALRAPVNAGLPVETGGVSFAWVGENKVTPVSATGFATNLMAITKFASILVFSGELAQLQSKTEQIFAARLVNGATRFFDSQVLTPTVTAIAGVRPASITSTGTAVTAGATINETVAKIINTFFAGRPSASRPVWMLSPAVASLLVGTGAHPDLSAFPDGRLAGFPAYATVGAGTTLVLADADGVYFDDAGAEVDTSRNASLQMNDAPTDPPDAAAVYHSLFQLDNIAVKLTRMASWIAEPSAVVYAPITLPTA